MNKKEFIDALNSELRGYPESEQQQYIDYYSEMIDDKIEDGLSEEEAITDIGSPQKSAAQIKAENPLPFSKKIKVPLKTWQIVLIAVGSPLWISLLIAALSVIFSLFASLCAMIISLYAGAVALGACAVAGILALVPMITKSNIPAGIMLAGMGLICAGLCILSFIYLNKLTRWLTALLKKLFVWVLNLFRKKEAVK